MSAWTSVGIWTLPSGNRVTVRTRRLPDGYWYGNAEWAYVPSTEDAVHYATVLWPKIFERMTALTGAGAGIMVPHP